MGLIRKLAKNSSNDFHNINRKMLCDIMGFWSGATSCCKCHGHSDDDACSKGCAGCIQTKAYKDILGLSLALMTYITHAEIQERTKRRRKKNK